MENSVGGILSELRRAKKLMQKDVAARLSEYGFSVSSKTIYNWEKGLAYPGIPQFLALCDILGVDDVLWQFSGIHRGLYAGLNSAGREKARELIDLLFHIDMFRDDFEEDSEPPRLLRLYDIPASAGTGNFLDDSTYELIRVPADAPPDVDFALRISGDSMAPRLMDGQIIWVRNQKTLNNGEIGIFIYSGEVYCKELFADGRRVYLKSLNPEYQDIEVKDDFGFTTIGKVVYTKH